MQTIETNKLSLSSFDNNRYVLEDGISTLPHGHYTIRDVHVEQDILDEREWGYEDEEMPTSRICDELNVIYPQNTNSQVFPDEAAMPVNARLPSPVRLSEYESISLTQELMEAWSPPDPECIKESTKNPSCKAKQTWTKLKKSRALQETHSSTTRRLKYPMVSLKGKRRMNQTQMTA